MNRSFIVILFIILVGLAGLYAFYARDKGAVTGPDVVSSEQEPVVREVVMEFGRRMKMVSVLSSQAGDEMQAQYAELVSPELLAQWKADPEAALGRQVSNPVPDSIDIVSVEHVADGTFRVEGNVIEVVASNSRVPAAVYPVTLIVERRGDAWLITATQKGAYSELPQEKTLAGETVCLPHKDMSGPITLECAIGLKTDVGEHYGLDMSALSPETFLDTGKRVEVTGLITPVEALSSIQKYDIKGVIRVSAVKEF